MPESKEEEEIIVTDSDSELLLGFRKLNVKLHFLSGDIEQLFKKKK